MSYRTLLLATRNRLRDTLVSGGLAYPSAVCEVQLGPEPPPVCGEKFVSIHEGSWQAEDIEGLSETFGLDVTVTFRVAKVPEDRQGTNALVGPTGASLDEECRKIVACIHLDKGGDAVLNAANTLLGGTVNGFCEPPRFRGADIPRLRGPDWFGAEDVSSGRIQNMGLSQTLHFGGAKRVQTIESMA